MNLLEKFLKHRALEYTHKRLGLDRIRGVLERLGHPERAYPGVLVAGTNGKGSVACMVEAVLASAGHRTGLYTSPHVERFTERIRIGGEEVAEEFLQEILEDLRRQGVLNAEGEMPAGTDTLSWFEKVTVLAFEAFRRKEVSLALLEVGLGARLDAVNAADPLVAAITSVGLDHTEVLGTSPFEIAREKLYVMRKGRPLVLGAMDANVRTFLNKAARLGGALPVMPAMPEGSWRDFGYGPFSHLALGMPGRHQMANAATAIEILVALKEAGFKIENAHVREGLKRAKLPARLECFPGHPTVLLDGAHNPQALGFLVDFIQREFSENPVTVILGLMSDKNPREALRCFTPLHPQWIFTEIPDSSRSLTMEDWRDLGAHLQASPEPMFFREPGEALEEGRKITPSNGLLVIAGSFYLAGLIRPRLFAAATTR